MIPEFRKQFNANWKPERYAQFLSRLDQIAGTHVAFRCSETPIFLRARLMDKMIRYGQELYEQLASNAEYRVVSEATIPNEFRVPNEAADPLFVQADFGLVARPDGGYEPKLVEIQGFPSLYGFQPALADVYRETYSLDSRLQALLGGLDTPSYVQLLRRAIVADHDPQETVLLEIQPLQQKTLCDFNLTEKLLGIRTVCVSDVEKRGRQLYAGGKRIRRIYNRVIVDELVRTRPPMNFRFADDLDVEWAGHPNWFFRLSKFSLPWFRHVCVPRTFFLDELQELPANLEDYVLKPLYSFAGLGVQIGPSAEAIAAIPANQRGNYILQEKMNFAAAVDTPAGLTKIEVRIMYIWDGELKPVTTIVRSGRGKMMGVDFNKNLDWVGASAGFVFEGP
ncbi:MAG TPA: hypothetical protein VG168_10415 [Bryobacteraceae bacterium]|nr:hypothetical protein [Bryobacteraceae bacterium]